MCPLTNISFFLYIVAYTTKSRVVGSLAKPLLWGVAIPFTLVYFLDNTSYQRMREKRGWNILTFWSGNLLLHYVPLVLPPPTFDKNPWYGLYAAMIHLTWAVIETNGTFILDDCYISLSKWIWYTCFIISFLIEITFYTSFGIFSNL